MRVRCDNQYKSEADMAIIFGQPRLCGCIGICFLSPAHESEIRGYFVYVLIIKYPMILKLSRSILHWTTLSRNFSSFCCCCWFFKTFFEGSVDRVIYRDYIVNRHFFIYCSLATVESSNLRQKRQGSGRWSDWAKETRPVLIRFCLDLGSKRALRRTFSP